MVPSMLLPLAVEIALSLGLTACHRRLPPAVSARLVAVTLAVVIAAAVPTLWIISLGSLTHITVLGGHLMWCAHAMGIERHVPTWIGFAAIGLSAVGLLRLRSVVRSYRRLCHDQSCGVEIADHAKPFAYTLPGRGGHVVVSSALVAMLDSSEQGIVLAHEQAHARYRHDRYLLGAQMAAALLPILRPLAGRLQFSLERWADEAAVAHCGDRRLVARTLGKVALRGAMPAGAIGFAGLGVPARVAALLAPPMTSIRVAGRVVVWSSVAVIGLLAALQVHHLAGLITALCLS